VTGKEKRALAVAKRIAVAIDGITGVDFGWAYRRHRRTRARAIRFHVDKKQPLDALAATARLPSTIDGIRVDVVQARYHPHARAPAARSRVDPRGRVDPLRPGASIGSIAGGHTGSLGALVRARDSGALCLLGSWHVLAAGATVGAAIAQPGPDDLGPAAPTTVATLLRAADLAHGIDAAIAALADGVAYDLVPLGSDHAPAAALAPQTGMRLYKSGRSTGLTHAIVDGEEGSFVIDYSAFGERRRWMDGVRLVVDPARPEDEISLNGDSGALWLEAGTHAAVALLFGGEDGLEPQAEYALAHPIAVVLERLRVELVTG
jgi:endonuclease G